ncbi:MAG: SGNH/GDSL hydrolase family protein [Rhodospirillaceae bacterium]
MKSQRTWLVNGLLVVASLLVGGLCMEIGARFFVDVPAPYPFPPGTASFDSRGFLTLRPGISGTMDNRVDFTAKAFTIDAAGDRRVPCAPVAGAQTKRIYLIGDSQTFGWGLGDEETWASRLQCRLQEAAADGFRVYNLGVPGDNVDQYWERFMEQVVPVLRPGDTAVASMTWNDLVDFYIGRRGLHDILKLAGLRIDESAGDGEMSLAVDPGFDLAARYPVAGQTEMQTNAHLRGAWKERLPTWRYDLYKRTGIFIPSFASAKAFAETMVHVSAAHAFLWPKARLLYYRFRPPATLSEKLPDNVFLFNFMTLAAMDRLARHRGATF